MNQETNSTVDRKERRREHKCSICRPNRDENSGRCPKHGEKKPRYKDKR